MQGLATILVDSVNKRRIKALIPHAERVDFNGSIDLLQALLRTRAIHGYQLHISYLRTVQSLRSSGSAHRKGREYEKCSAKVRLAELGPQRVIAILINRGNDLLRFLLMIVETTTNADTNDS